MTKEEYKEYIKKIVNKIDDVEKLIFISTVVIRIYNKQVSNESKTE